jgi:hypothetical protein
MEFSLESRLVGQFCASRGINSVPFDSIPFDSSKPLDDLPIGKKNTKSSYMHKSVPCMPWPPQFQLDDSEVFLASIG